LREALLHAHWLEVQQHVYAHAWHGTVTTMPGWIAFIWQHFARRQILVCPTQPYVSLGQLDRFLAGMNATTDVMLETCPALHEDLEVALADRWQVGYELPGHFIPTDQDWLDSIRVGFPGQIREVVDDNTAADFAYVQDKAYQESYDWPRGCAAMFYSDVASLVGPDTIGAVMYDDGDRPVRTAQIVVKRGIVGGIAGAAVPAVRGKHYGQALMYYLARRARIQFGAPVVHHVTMPVARPIATRLGLEEVSLYRRWVRRREAA
jgi:hypothetical protein